MDTDNRVMKTREGVGGMGWMDWGKGKEMGDILIASTIKKKTQKSPIIALYIFLALAFMPWRKPCKCNCIREEMQCQQAGGRDS